MGAREKHFNYSGDQYTEEDICDFLRTEGLSFRKSSRMAYDAPEIPKDWPLRGYWIDGYDISFEAPAFDIVRQSEIGHVDLAAEFQSANYKASLALFKKLKRQFEMTTTYSS